MSHTVDTKETNETSRKEEVQVIGDANANPPEVRFKYGLLPTANDILEEQIRASIAVLG